MKKDLWVQLLQLNLTEKASKHIDKNAAYYSAKEIKDDKSKGK